MASPPTPNSTIRSAQSAAPQAGPIPSFCGVNHNIYSQSTWTAGSPLEGTNYRKSDHRLIDYFYGKGMRFLRLMFTWEWLQPTLGASIPGTDAYLMYWNSFVDTINYATSLGMNVLIEHYGYSSNFWADSSGNTTPSWKGVGSGDGVSYTNQIGGGSVTNADFADLWTKLADYFKSNPLVCYGTCNEPHHLSTMQWFGTAQAVINAIRATGSTQWIFVPGNGYSTWQWTTSSYDSAATKRSSADGWENANGVGSPLGDPLNKLIASPHVYLDDAGGSSYNINAINAGTQENALVDRISTVVSWARTFNTNNPAKKVYVHLSEIGFYGAATNAGLGGNYSLSTVQGVWSNFLSYLNANSDVLLGFSWWGASDVGFWDDPGKTHFSITPTTPGTPYSGDTVNMSFLTGLGSFP